MKRKQNKYTIKQQREAVALYRGGLGVGSTARAVGIPQSTVRSWVRAAGIMRSQQEGERLHGLRRRRRGAVDPRRQTAAVLYERLSAAQIARVMGVSAGTVRRWLHEAGVALRSKRDANRMLFNDPSNPVAAERLRRIQGACRRVMDGEDTQAVAAAYGVTRRAVQLWLRSEHNPYRIDTEMQARAIASAAERRGTERANGRRAA